MFTAASLKLKLILGAIASMLLLLLVQSVGQYYALRSDLVGAIERSQFDLLGEITNHLDDKMAERLQMLAHSTSSLPDDLGDPAALERHLRGKPALLALFNDLYVFDARGMLLVDWPQKPGRRGLDMSERDYIQHVIEKREAFISRPILGKATRQPIVVLAAPVLDKNGQLRAIVGGVLNLYQPNLLGELGKRRIGENGYLYLVSAERSFIAHPDKSRIMQPIPGDEENPALARAFAGFEGTLEGVNSRGLSGLFTFKRMRTTQWILVSVVPEEEAFRPIGEIRRTMAGITLLVVLLAMPLLWLASRRLIAPLEQLARAMRERAASMRPRQPSAPVAEQGSEEIRTVAAAFNGFLAARNEAEEALAVAEEQRNRMMENLAQARDAAEAASKAKSDFLANMSHEIRTPMNGVIGMLELAQQNPLDAETREYLQIARTSAQSLLAILNDILDVSKIEAGKMHIEQTPFSIPAVCHDVMQLMLPQAHEKGLALTTEIDPAIPRILLGDSLRVRQVLLNLVGNAVKFTAQGRVTLSATVVERNSQGMVLSIAIADTGIGIPADRLDGIFKAFAQADSSTTRRYGGTGLGLTISRQLVELMGGELAVSSTEGQGSLFRFSLLLQEPGEHFPGLPQ